MPTIRITTTLASVERDARAVAAAIAATHDEIAVRTHRATVQTRLWSGAFAGPLRTATDTPDHPSHAPRGFLRFARANRRSATAAEYHRLWGLYLTDRRAEIAQQPRVAAALAALGEDTGFGRRVPLSATAAHVEDLTAAHAVLLAVASVLRRARDLRITTVEAPDATPAAVCDAIKTHPKLIEAEEQHKAILEAEGGRSNV